MSGYSALLVEDQADDAVSIQRALRDANIESWQVVSSAHDALETVNSYGPFDLHIFDLHLPDASDLQLLEQLRSEGFTRWDRSIVITGVAGDNEKGQAISQFGMPVVEKERLASFLGPWVKGIVERAPGDWTAAVMAAFGAAAWGNGRCGLVWIEGAIQRQVNQIVPDLVSVALNQSATLALLPQVGLKDTLSLRTQLLERLPGQVTARSLVLTDIAQESDMGSLSKLAIDTLRDEAFDNAIWPLDDR